MGGAQTLNRDYDPEVGRWTSKDPIGFKSREYSLYSYANMDPVNQADYLGKGPITAVKVALVCVGVVGVKSLYENIRTSKAGSKIKDLLAEQQDIDFKILDANLAGNQVECDRLEARKDQLPGLIKEQRDIVGQEIDDAIEELGLAAVCAVGSAIGFLLPTP